MSGNQNFPYSLLSKENGTLRLSVIVNRTSSYIINDDLNKDTAKAERQLKFEKTTPPGDRLVQNYEVTKTDSATYTMTITVEGGETNQCMLRVEDAIDSTNTAAQPLRYFPHCYLSKTRTGVKLVYNLHIAIPTVDGRIFKHVDTVFTNTVRTLIIQESALATFRGDTWPLLIKISDEPASREKIVILVYDKDADLNNNTVADGKGTVRHSSADIKPFDLLGCD